MKNLKSDIARGLKICILALVLSVGVSYVFADWTAPPATPPTCPTTGANLDPACFPPIHVGAAQQDKAGPLRVTGFRSFAAALFDENVVFEKLIQIKGGNPGTGKVLISDAIGLASWAPRQTSSPQEACIALGGVWNGTACTFPDNTTGTTLQQICTALGGGYTAGPPEKCTIFGGGDGGGTQNGVAYDSGWFRVTAGLRQFTTGGNDQDGTLIPPISGIALPYNLNVYVSAATSGKIAVAVNGVHGTGANNGIQADVQTNGQVRLVTGANWLLPINTPNFDGTNVNTANGFARIVIGGGGGSGGTGGGSITNIIGGPNITIVNPTGPTVTVDVNPQALCQNLGGTYLAGKCIFPASASLSGEVACPAVAQQSGSQPATKCDLGLVSDWDAWFLTTHQPTHSGGSWDLGCQIIQENGMWKLSLDAGADDALQCKARGVKGTPGSSTGGGGVTQINQGAGITLSPSPITTTGTVSADTTYLQRRILQTCSAGQVMRGANADGTPICIADATGTAPSGQTLCVSLGGTWSVNRCLLAGTERNVSTSFTGGGSQSGSYTCASNEVITFVSKTCNSGRQSSIDSISGNRANYSAFCPGTGCANTGICTFNFKCTIN